jgi:predicted transcriptional regulator
MLRKKNLNFSEFELDLIKVLWDSSTSLTLNELFERIGKDPKPKFNVFLDLVQKMEKKNYIEQVKKGNEIAYFIRTENQSFLSKEIFRISERLFGSGPLSLVMNLFENEKLDREEIEQIRKSSESL